MNKPYAASCDENCEPILKVIKTHFKHCIYILEIGSGTGQHAVYFAKQLPYLVWQTSDRIENHSGIEAWIKDSCLTNIDLPIGLDVSKDAWPKNKYDAIYSANTMHIMHWDDVKNFFEGVGRVLNSEGLLCLYGPFNDDGQYTSESNARFDIWLKNADPQRAIRNKQDLDVLASKAGLDLIETISMPENNFILIWKKY